MNTVIVSILLICSLLMPAIAVQAAGLPIRAVDAPVAQLPNIGRHTIDGDPGTRWSAQGDGVAITYQLETCQVVTAVRVAFWQGNKRQSDFEIHELVGVAWETGFTGMSSGKTNELEAFDIPDQMTCFVRIVGYGNTKNNWTSILEVELVGEPDVNREPPPVSFTGVEESDSTDGHHSDKMYDGDLSTYWESPHWGQWALFRLSEPTVIDEVMVAWPDGTNGSTEFSIEFFDEGQNQMQIVYWGFSSGRTTRLESYRFAPQEVQSIRITVMGRVDTDYSRISEIQFIRAQSFADAT